MKCIFGACKREACADLGLVCRYHQRHMTRANMAMMRTAWRSMAIRQREIVMKDQKENPVWGGAE